jgi:hypothetical protein
MRELKFRAWDDNNKVFVERFGIDNNGNVCFTVGGLSYTPEGKLFHDDTKMIVEQFTGLHDKNGKEIYEGDIITLGEENKAWPVVWDNERGAFCAIINNIAIRMHVDFWKSGKIIGNIHENPELLEAKE